MSISENLDPSEGATICDCGNMDPVEKMKMSKLTFLEFSEPDKFPKTDTLKGCIPEFVRSINIEVFPRLDSSDMLQPLKELKYFKQYKGIRTLPKN